jgi:hypothetical protein
MSLDELCDAIARAVEQGADLHELQDEVIGAAPGLTEDERAGLWLFAWSYAARLRETGPRALVEVRR